MGPSERSRAVRPFLVMDILERARAMEASGVDVVHMEVGEPDLPPPAAAVEAGVNAVLSGRTGYTPSPGLPELRDAIAGMLSKEHDVTVEASRVVVTSGSSGALLLAFAALCEPGDEVLVTDPGYPCYPNICRTLGIEVRTVPVGVGTGFAYDPDVLRAAVGPRTKAIVVNSPANPTGAVTTGEVLAELASIGIPVVSDEVYQGLTYDEPAESMLAVSETSFVSGGFSKRHAMTGWRVGYLVAPADYLRVVTAMQQNLYISASEPGQWAALAAIDAAEELESMRRTYDDRRRFLLTELERLGLPVGVIPRGAFYAFVDASAHGSDSTALAADILQHAHVAVTPGVDFGSRGEGWLRFSYAASIERIAEGTRRLATYLAAG